MQLLFSLSCYGVVTALIFQSVNGMMTNQNTKLYSNTNGDFSVAIKQDNNRDQNITFSTDFGESWKTFDNVPDSGPWTSLTLTESNQIVVATMKILFHNFDNNDTESLASTAVYKSNDFGKSWEQVLKGLESPHVLPISSIATSKSTEFIYVSSGRNVSVSADKYNPSLSFIVDNYAPPAGDTIIKTSVTGQYTYVLSYSFVFSDDDHKYDDMRNNFLGVAYKSFDFGLTWEPIDSLSSSSNWKSLHVSSNGKQVLTSRGFQSVLLTLDYGQSFVNIIDNIHAESVDVLETNQTGSGCNTHSEWDDDDCYGDTTAIGGSYYIQKDISEVTAVTMSNNGLHIVISAKCNDISSSMLIFSHDRGQSWSKTSCDKSNDFVEMSVGDKGERIIGVLADDTIVVTRIAAHPQEQEQEEQQDQQTATTDLSSPPVTDKLNLRRRPE